MLSSIHLGYQNRMKIPSIIPKSAKTHFFFFGGGEAKMGHFWPQKVWGVSELCFQRQPLKLMKYANF